MNPGAAPIEVRIALLDLVHEFAYLVDFGPAETVADLFAEDGWYAWGDKRSVGRDAIRETYRQRAARGMRTARHLCTNLRISMVGDHEARGQSIWLIFAEDGPPPHAAVPLLVADVHDVYVRRDGRWLFRSRQLDDVFVAPDRTPVLPLTVAGGDATR
jgi:SnoaL-like domain